MWSQNVATTNVSITGDKSDMKQLERTAIETYNEKTHGKKVQVIFNERIADITAWRIRCAVLPRNGRLP